MSSTATYLYCLVKSATAPTLRRVPPGVPGGTRPVLAPIGRSLRIVVANVPLEIYGSGPLERSLSDMAWVSEVALAHEAVVEHFARARGATVVPMKLFTMFSSLERTIEDVAARRRDVDRVLARVAGCSEWGVRISRPSARPAARPRRAAASGAAFLAEKLQARDAARQAAVNAAAAAEEAYEVLTPLARASRRREGEPGGAVSPPLVEAAFLVRAAALPRFKAAARRAAAICAAAGADMTLTGPWPPYNFVQVDDRS